MDLGISGRSAIVTGAAGGIGGAIARDLAREGVNLALAYHNKECPDLVAEIEGLGVGVIAVKTDICSGLDVEGLVQRTYQRFGRIDILVNNAGLGLLGAVEDTTEADW